MNYSELLQLTKGWGNFVSDRINIWRLQCLSIVYFHVTQKCNLNCRYCYNKHNLNVKSELSTSQVKYVLETLNRNGIKTINFTGGEALIREDIFEIIEYSKQLGFKNVLLTNGTLLKDKMGVLRSVDECIISIDNWDEDSNDDERRGSKNYSLLSMLDEIDASVKEKVKIRSVIVKGKEKELHENKKYFEKKGFLSVPNICGENRILYG